MKQGAIHPTGREFKALDKASRFSGVTRAGTSFSGDTAVGQSSAASLPDDKITPSDASLGYYVGAIYDSLKESTQNTLPGRDDGLPVQAQSDPTIRKRADDISLELDQSGFFGTVKGLARKAKRSLFGSRNSNPGDAGRLLAWLSSVRSKSPAPYPVEAPFSPLEEPFSERYLTSSTSTEDVSPLERVELCGSPIYELDAPGLVEIDNAPIAFRIGSPATAHHTHHIDSPTATFGVGSGYPLPGNHQSRRSISSESSISIVRTPVNGLSVRTARPQSELDIPQVLHHTHTVSQGSSLDSNSSSSNSHSISIGLPFTEVSTSSYMPGVPPAFAPSQIWLAKPCLGHESESIPDSGRVNPFDVSGPRDSEDGKITESPQSSLRPRPAEQNKSVISTVPSMEPAKNANFGLPYFPSRSLTLPSPDLRPTQDPTSSSDIRGTPQLETLQRADAVPITDCPEPPENIGLNKRQSELLTSQSHITNATSVPTIIDASLENSERAQSKVEKSTSSISRKAVSGTAGSLSPDFSSLEPSTPLPIETDPTPGPTIGTVMNGNTTQNASLLSSNTRGTYFIIFMELALAAVLSKVGQLMTFFLQRYGGEPEVPEGYVRIRWTCKCGKRLFDDFVEKREGAARELEQHLNRPRAYASGDNSAGSSNTSSLRTISGSTSTHGISSSITSQDISDMPFHPYGPVPTTENKDFVIQASPHREDQWLLTCVTVERFTPKLMHLDMDPRKIRSDKDLAMALKDRYNSRLKRKWYSPLRLRELATIRFVQFEVHRTHVVDIRKCPDMPPKNASRDYYFNPYDLLPPVGEQYLMHLFHHPEDYDDERITYLRVPKKRGRPLRIDQYHDAKIGWGVNLVDGFFAERMWTFLTGFFVIGSLTFAVAWVVKRRDVQGAFGVASWMCTLVAIFLGWCQRLG